LHRIARRFAHYVIRQFAAAAETYPELSIAEILPLCEAALARDLAFELESAYRQAIRASHEGSSACGEATKKRFV
jgi:hypothetical protein